MQHFVAILAAALVFAECGYVVLFPSTKQRVERMHAILLHAAIAMEFVWGRRRNALGLMMLVLPAVWCSEMGA